jgi:hypothetical protein
MIKNKNPLIAFALIVAFMAVLVGCNETTSNDMEKGITERAAKQFNKAQPPYIVDASQARENLNAAELAMATGANSWTAVFARGGQLDHPIFECPSEGFPIPFASNITNPLKTSGGQGAVLNQQEPTLGIYTPATADMTYGNCILPDGKVGNFTSESDITTWAFDVQWNPEKKMYEIPTESNGTVTRKEGDVVTTERLTPEQINAHSASPDEMAKLPSN